MLLLEQTYVKDVEMVLLILEKHVMTAIIMIMMVVTLIVDLRQVTRAQLLDVNVLQTTTLLLQDVFYVTKVASVVQVLTLMNVNSAPITIKK